MCEMSCKDEENTFSSGMPPYTNTGNKELSISPKIHCKQQVINYLHLKHRCLLELKSIRFNEVHPLDASQRNGPLPTNSTLLGRSEAKHVGGDGQPSVIVGITFLFTSDTQ